MSKMSRSLSLSASSLTRFILCREAGWRKRIPNLSTITRSPREDTLRHGTAATLFGRGSRGLETSAPIAEQRMFLIPSSLTAELPDMKNVYDGVVALDNKGKAEIELPDLFGILNKDFRYQLTAIGSPGPNLYIAEEISDTTTSNKSNNNSRHFKVAGGASGMELSWQVTGIRKDPWANAHRIQVEEEKPDKERGYYVHPDLYDQPEESGIKPPHLSKRQKEKNWARAIHK